MYSLAHKALFGLLFTIALTSTDSYQAKDKLTVLAIEYPPFTSAKVSDANLSRDLLKSYFNNSSLELEFRVLPLSRGLKLMSEGKWEASLIPINKEIGQDYCSLTYSKDELTYSIISKAEYESLELKGAKIATLKSREDSQYIKKLTKLGLNIVPVNNYNQLFKLLEAGRVQFITGVVSQNRVVLPSSSSSNTFVEIKALSEIPLALYVNSSVPELAKLCD